ncbi:hypothetical protein B0T10DRAFT_605187 [Thelonectria olida]|uniref:Uncharacterized protein n=1 Tax=Thelonectria olida TaxID=1576542 RepID=A0A9P9AR74_9HYPO|nr:hypothetical protein B0T10DRAFT_605187 [Thelonectria olida]
MMHHPKKILFTLSFPLWELFDLSYTVTHDLRPLDRFSTLLRSVGLGILTHFSRDREEPPKVLISTSWKQALARSAIHVLPASVSITLMAVNIQGYFIGSELQGHQNQDALKLGLLQVAAKTQELLIVSSLAAVIFHVLRAELMFGQGLPLGLVVSGWSFTQISYFWSAEFWGGVISNETTPKGRGRRVFVTSLVLISGILAIMAGPAAAVLMVPRTMEWAIGGGIFWMNGSEEQIWPTYLDDQYYREFECGDEWRQTMDPRCPSAGFIPLSQHYTIWWSLSDAPFEFEIQDSNLRKAMHVVPSARNHLDTWAYTTHATSATMQDAMRSMHAKSLSYLQNHRHGSPKLGAPDPQNLLYAETKKFEVKTKAPAVRTTCLGQDNVDLYSGNLTLLFPILREFQAAGLIPDLYGNSSGLYEVEEIDVFDHVKDHLFRRGLLKTNTSLDESMFNGTRTTLAVPLDIWNHTASSIGIVLMFNATDMLNTSTYIAACSVDARWANAKSIIETNERIQLEHDFERTRVRNLVRTELEVPGFGTVDLDPFIPPRDGSMRVIRIQPSWFDVFAPVIPEVPYVLRANRLDGQNQTTLEKAMEATRLLGAFRLVDAQHLIATCVADGLSRCGMIPNDLPSRFLGAWRNRYWGVDDEHLARTMFRDGEPKESFEKPPVLAGCNTTRLVMRAYFKGYAISAKGGFDRFCIAVLLAHALIALVHTMWSVCKSSETSGAWESIVELIALTLKSPSPSDPILSNTGAEVRSFKTIGSVAWVETSPAGGRAREQVRFRVKGNTQDRDMALKPAPGEFYG